MDTDTQQHSHGQPPGAAGDAGTDTLGPGCSWTADAHSGVGNDLAITWVTTSSTGLGLQFTYARKSVFKYWTTTTVDGYPAVIGDVMDDRAKGSCTINVGVSDTMLFIADYNGWNEPQKSQSCQLVQQVAADVIKNLGG